MRHWAVIQSRIVLFVLTRHVARTRLTQREFVIAAGHHFRSRTTAPKCLILRPAREKRSQTVSNGEPLFRVERTLGDRRSFLPGRAREHHRSLDLPLRNVPLFSQKAGRLLPRQIPVAVLLVEPHGPGRGGPGADQDRLSRRALEALEQQPTDTVVPLRGLHVGVADELHLAAVLDPHHAYQLAALLVPPETDALADFLLQVVHRHVRLVPPIGGDDSLVGLRRIVDDPVQGRKVLLVAGADHRSSTLTRLGRPVRAGVTGRCRSPPRIPDRIGARDPACERTDWTLPRWRPIEGPMDGE